MINFESDARQRQRQIKRKIFGEQANRSKQEQKSFNDNVVIRRSQHVDSSSLTIGVVQDLKQQVEELYANNVELKNLLKEERERYDKLFQEYEQVVEKNSLIEKEYINLKYEHNKEFKELKKHWAASVAEHLQKHIQDLHQSLREQKLTENVRFKIQKFVQRMRDISHINITNKTNKHSSIKSRQFLQQKHVRGSYLLEKQTKSQNKILDAFLINELPMIQKQLVSPSKRQQQLIVVQSSIQSSELSVKQIILQDEYYGEIQDFAHYEQKVMQRRNYELMKKNSRNSNDIKRKKIFDPVGAFNC